MNKMANLVAEILGDEEAGLQVAHHVIKQAEIDYNWSNLATKILRVFD